MLDSWRTLAMLAIDAMAVGISMAFLGTAVLMPVLVIGLVSLVLSTATPHLGCLAAEPEDIHMVCVL